MTELSQKRQASAAMQSRLRYELLATIMNFEKLNDYHLKPCEVNKVLLSLLEDSVNTALKAVFGNTTKS